MLLEISLHKLHLCLSLIKVFYLMLCYLFELRSERLEFHVFLEALETLLRLLLAFFLVLLLLLPLLKLQNEPSLLVNLVFELLKFCFLVSESLLQLFLFLICSIICMAQLCLDLSKRSFCFG